jgi:hypothetical protein
LNEGVCSGIVTRYRVSLLSTPLKPVKVVLALSAAGVTKAAVRDTPEYVMYAPTTSSQRPGFGLAKDRVSVLPYRSDQER